MNIEMPVFNEGTNSERISQIEKWICYLAEQIASAPFQISGFERSSASAECDEITVTYPDGSKVRYLAARADRK